jgi:site-specific recombinase XerD
MIGLSAFDSAGRRRSPATMPGARRGTRDALPGRPTDGGGDRRGDAPGRRRPSGWRLRAMIIVLGRAGLRVQEALALAEHDLDPRRAVGSGSERQGGRRREVGMDERGWEQLRPWLSARAELPLGPLFCIIDGPTRGRAWSGAAVRSEFRRLAAQAGLRRRFAPHQLRHAHALELVREGVPLNIIQRQLGHTNSARPRSTCKESTPRRSSPPSARDAPR